MGCCLGDVGVGMSAFGWGLFLEEGFDGVETESLTRIDA